jgi:hypothetical protein
VIPGADASRRAPRAARPGRRRVRPGPAALLACLLLALAPDAALAQTTGRLIGRVVDAETAAPLARAFVRVERLGLETTTDDVGRFLLAGLPAGRHEVSAGLLGYGTVRLEDVPVRVARATELEVELRPSAIEVEPLRVEAERVPLIEPEVPETREVITGSELRELPVTRVQEAVELATGVADGHFRGGQVGQETYLVDGVEVKNQLEGTTPGSGLQFSRTALQEIEVITGGFGAEYGSALSGVVSYRTRSGNPDRWESSVRALTDQWAPESASAGFTELGATAGGPLGVLGEGATLFADLQLQGLLDADPRARGLACLRPEDAGPELAERIRALRDDPTVAPLYCPYAGDGLPHQRGDLTIGFLRVDKRFSDGVTLAAGLLHNRFQRELYTPELKYAESQLGQKSTGWLGTLTLDLSGQMGSGGRHLAVRLAAQRLDRYLGAIDPDWMDGRSTIAGWGASGFRFLGEDFVRLPIERQLDSVVAVPGYEAPAGLRGSPFGPAAEGLFTTEGTSGIANWSRSDFLGLDAVGELFTAGGGEFRGGVSGKLYQVETYERTRAWLAGSAPNYARFYPAKLSGFGEAVLRPGELFTVTAGLRVDGFRSGLEFREDRGDFLAPTISTDWKLSASPRVGFAGAFRNSAGRTAFRVNYARVAQPPDFQFFIDNTIGDSLRTDVRRQGNPNLAFERGRIYEVGGSHLFGETVGLELALFRKELTDLVTGNLQLGGTGPGRYTTGDRGSVTGVEFSVRGRWPGAEARLGYALMEATGLTTGAANDTTPLPPGQTREFPLAFDRRHTVDGTLFLGRAAGRRGSSGLAGLPVGAVVTAKVRSGYPLYLEGGDGAPEGNVERLPWTAVVDLGLSWEFARLPGCGSCDLRLVFQAKNLLGRDDVVALRRDSGLIAPTLETVEALAARPVSTTTPVPAESSRYAREADLDRDGMISAEEFGAARFAAALDRNDPSLFYGERMQLRLGLEVAF